MGELKQRYQHTCRRSQMDTSDEPDGLCKGISDEDMKDIYGKGFALMEKMGYSSSHGGLGKHRQGITRPVQGKYKSRCGGDSRGLGSPKKIGAKRKNKQKKTD